MNITTMLRKAIMTFTVTAAAISAFTLTADAYELEQHTKEEIEQAYRNMYYFDIHDNVDYTEDYTDDAPFNTGDISAEDRQNAVNAINFFRYLAGLPSDVSTKDNYNYICQNAAYLGYMNDNINHYPGRPGNLYSEDAEYNAVADNIYAVGYAGCASSNLSLGDFTPAESIIGYMNDTDDYNKSAVGHRRWILNPDMKYTGIGTVEKFSTMYAKDRARNDSFTGGYIAWPAAGYMPYELIYSSSYNSNGYLYSVTLGKDYMDPEMGKVTITVESKLTGQTMVFNGFNNELKSYYNLSSDLCGYYTPDQDGSAKGKTLIFNPGDLPENDEVTVKITGIYKKNGEEAPIEYTVKYFNLLNKNDYTVGYSQSEYTIPAGETIYISCYNNPLSSAGYSIYTEPLLRDLRAMDTVRVWRIDSTMFIRCEEEMNIKLRIVNSNRYFVGGASEINFTHKHDYEWITDEEPTDTEPGTKHQECKLCGDKKESKAIPARSIAAAEIILNDENSTMGVDKNTMILTPVVTVRSSNTQLVEGKDYTVSYEEDHPNNVVRVTVTGIGSYNGSKTVESDLIDISGDDFIVKISNSTSKKYTGSQVNVPVTVQPVNEYALKDGKDYIVKIDSNYNAGTHTAKVTGMGIYGGEVELTYYITAANLPKIGSLGDVTFDGTPKTFNIVLKDSKGNVLTQGVDYDLYYYNNDSIGEARVLAVACENGNYTGESEATFNILPVPKPVVEQPEEKQPEEETVIEEEKKSEEEKGSENNKSKEPKVEKHVATITVDGSAPAMSTTITLVDAKGEKFDADLNGGIFNASVPEGKYDAWITCDGYCPKKCEFTVGTDPVEINTDLYRFGDVDMNDEIDISDAVNLINNINGISPLADEQTNIGDVNLDGEIDIADAVAIINNINGTSALEVDNEKAISIYVKNFNSIPDEIIPDEDIAYEETTSDEDYTAAAAESDTEEENKYAGEDGKVYVICEKNGIVTIKVYANESDAEPEKKYAFSKDNSMSEAPEGFEKIDEAFYNEITSKLRAI